MMDGCIREGRCLLLPLPFPILLEVWKVQVLSICLFAWKALWMLQQVHSLHPGISVSLFTQESLLLLPQGVHIFFKCDLCVLICDDKKNGLIRLIKLKISSAAWGLILRITAIIKKLWLKTSYKMHVHIHTVHMHTPTYRSTFMLADILVSEMQAVEMQIQENGKMPWGGFFYATPL